MAMNYFENLSVCLQSYYFIKRVWVKFGTKGPVRLKISGPML